MAHGNSGEFCPGNPSRPPRRDLKDTGHKPELKRWAILLQREPRGTLRPEPTESIPLTRGGAPAAGPIPDASTGRGHVSFSPVTGAGSPLPTLLLAVPRERRRTHEVSRQPGQGRPERHCRALGGGPGSRPIFPSKKTEPCWMERGRLDRGGGQRPLHTQALTSRPQGPQGKTGVTYNFTSL